MGLGTDFGVTGSGYYVSRYTDAPNGTRYIVLNRASAQVEIQSTSAHTALATACTLAVADGGGVVEIGLGTYALNTQTISATVTLRMSGGLLSVNSGQTLTIAGTLEAPAEQIFSGAGAVVLSGPVAPVPPQWWGAVGDGSTDDTDAFSAATTALAAQNGTLVLLPGIYSVSNLTIPSDVSVLPLGGVLQVQALATVTINGPLLGEVDGASIFTGSGTGSLPASHSDATTSVHGIANTAVLATATTLATAVSDHAALADPHTVYQLESSLAATVKAYRLDEFAAPNASVGLGSQKITSLADPVAATDGVNLRTAESLGSATTWKSAVRAATTTAGTLATSFENGDTIDGVVLATGDRILIKDQGSGSPHLANGVYIVAASGAPARATDVDTGAEIVAGTTVLVNEGTVNTGSGWRQSTTGAITLETTAMLWVQSNQGTAYTATAPITLTGNAFGITSPLPVASGGTNATSASAALTSLGAVPAALVDAKGDLFTASAADTPARLAVGANDTILMADSGETTGLKWAAAATTPSTQAFGDAAAAGTADTFTRGDHKHAMPADSVTAHVAAADPHTGYVLESLVDAKGDLITGSANNTVARVAVGTDGQFLTASAAATGGVAWTTVAPGAGASISGTPVAADLPRWASATAIGSSSAASPAKGPLILRGPVYYNPLYHTNLLPLKSKLETWVDLLPYIHAARDAIVSDGWPGILQLSGGFWPVSDTVVLNNPLVGLEGVGSSHHSAYAAESAGSMNTGSTILAMDNFAGEEVLRIRRAARITTTGTSMDHHKARRFAIDGNMKRGTNVTATFDGILYAGTESFLSEFSVALCPGNGLYILPPASDEIFETQIDRFNIRYCGRSGLYLGTAATDMHISHFTVFGCGIDTLDGSIDGADIVNFGDGIQIAGGSANQWHDFQVYDNRRRGVTVIGARQKFMGNMKIENNTRGGVHISNSDGSQFIGGGFANNSRAAAETYDDLEIASGAANIEIADCWMHPNVYGDTSRSRYGINITSNPVGINIRDCDFGTYRGSAADQAAGTLTAKDARIKVGGSATGVRIRNCHPYNPYGRIVAPAVPATYVAGTATPVVQNLKPVVCQVNIVPLAGCTITEIYHGTTSGTVNMLALGIVAGLAHYTVDVAPGAYIGIVFSGGDIDWWWQGL